MSKDFIEYIHIVLCYIWFISAILIYVNDKYPFGTFKKYNGGQIVKITTGKFYQTFHLDWEGLYK